MDFAPITTCDELNELVTPACLLFDVCISAESDARQMSKIKAKVAERVRVIIIIIIIIIIF